MELSLHELSMNMIRLAKDEQDPLIKEHYLKLSLKYSEGFIDIEKSQAALPKEDNKMMDINKESLVKQAIVDTTNEYNLKTELEILAEKLRSETNSNNGEALEKVVKAISIYEQGETQQAAQAVSEIKLDNFSLPEKTPKLKQLFQATSTQFISSAERERIQPWKTIVDHDEFKIERERIGDIETQDTLKLIQKYGICLLRLFGQPPSEDVLRAYFESIGQVAGIQNEFAGEVKDLKPSPDVVANTGSSAGDLGFHVDGTQAINQPALLAFQYIVTADIRGNSKFVDLAKVILDIAEEERKEILVNLSKSNAASFDKKEMNFTGPLFNFPDNHSLACRVRFDDVITCHEDCQSSFETLKNSVYSDYGITFKPRPGDIIIFDNWRIMHARDEVLGNAQRHHRRVWLNALLPQHQINYKMGIRPILPETISAMKEAMSN